MMILDLPSPEGIKSKITTMAGLDHDHGGADHDHGGPDHEHGGLITTIAGADHGSNDRGGRNCGGRGIRTHEDTSAP